MSNRNRLQNTPEPRLARRDTLKLGGTLLGVAGLGPLLAGLCRGRVAYCRSSRNGRDNN